MAALEISGMNVEYDGVRAVSALSLEVDEGEIVALIGGNGAGKSTTLNAISGLIRTCTGRIRFRGTDITAAEPHRIVEAGLLQVPEGRRVFSTLTVEENLDMGAFARTDRDQIAHDKQDIFTRFPILSQRRRQLAGTCSGGEQQMLAIGRALMARPRLLMLDEPSLGLAPLIVRDIFRTIRELNRERGMSILLVEQNARMALKLANRATVLDRGRTTLHGSSAALLQDPAVQHAFLGRSVAVPA
ncbi:MAG TPA: ABC transporter ATP-binding protein [Acetobacteraceae bacterium]|nr:ABC transporter ATP-binding protein [Acetobacteraceae bacterium]